MGRVGTRDKDIPDYRNCGKIRVLAYRLDDVLKYQLCPLVVGKNTNSRFLRFFVRSVPLFRSLVLTPMIHASH